MYVFCNSIFLVDHAWTYRVSDCRPQLEQIPGLLERMAALMDIQSEERSKEEVIEDILQKMWKYVLISVKYKHTFLLSFHKV